jgi:hypothetical protein
LVGCAWLDMSTFFFFAGMGVKRPPAP